MPTKRRIYRVAKVMHQRQDDIIIALDGVHDPHNIAAVVRTADATGIGHIIWQPDVIRGGTLNPEVSKGSERWVNIEKTKDLANRLKELKELHNYNIAATHMGKQAVDFRSIDWTKPWVVIMGNEQCGCSEETTKIADKNIYLPMCGFVQSLNISVATAVILYEIHRQREAAGMYNKQKNLEQVKKYFIQWKLEDDKFELDSLLHKPQGQMPENSFVHKDGRGIRKVKQGT